MKSGSIFTANLFQSTIATLVVPLVTRCSNADAFFLTGASAPYSCLSYRSKAHLDLALGFALAAPPPG